MEPGIIPGIHLYVYPDEITARELQWSPGSFPGYTDVFPHDLLPIGASMEPGIIPGIHMDQQGNMTITSALQWSPGSFPGYTGDTRCRRRSWTRFNGARDLSRDTLDCIVLCLPCFPLQWNPGSLPGYTLAPTNYRCPVYPLQWSPGSLPGYTGAPACRSRHHPLFNRARDIPGIHLSLGALTSQLLALQWSPGLLPEYTISWAFL